MGDVIQTEACHSGECQNPDTTLSLDSSLRWNDGGIKWVRLIKTLRFELIDNYPPGGLVFDEYQKSGIIACAIIVYRRQSH